MEIRGEDRLVIVENQATPDEWMFLDDESDLLDGDHASALASAGFGTDEDYGGADAGGGGWE